MNALPLLAAALTLTAALPASAQTLDGAAAAPAATESAAPQAAPAAPALVTTSTAAAPAAVTTSSAAAPAAVATSTAAAPTSIRPINISFIPPLSLDGGTPPDAALSLNIIAGRLRSLRGLEFGAVLNIETEEMMGLQYAGVANVVTGNVTGAQFAGALNRADRVLGVQYAGGFNSADDVRGLQFAGGFNHAGAIQGAQFAPLNLAGDAGAQFGVVNVATGNTGLQVGTLNLAKRCAVPIGLVNIAQDADAPIGLINLIKNGYHVASVWTSDLARVNAGLKLGGRVLYTYFGAGFDPQTNVNRRWMASAGLGAHLRLSSWFFVDTDVGSTMVFENARFAHAVVPATLRVVAGLQLGNFVAITAGPTLNVVTSWNGENLDLARTPQQVFRNDEATVRIFPGFTVGVQL